MRCDGSCRVHRLRRRSKGSAGRQKEKEPKDSSAGADMKTCAVRMLGETNFDRLVPLRALKSSPGELAASSSGMGVRMVHKGYAFTRLDVREEAGLCIVSFPTYLIVCV